MVLPIMVFFVKTYETITAPTIPAMLKRINRQHPILRHFPRVCGGFVFFMTGFGQFVSTFSTLLKYCGLGWTTTHFVEVASFPYMSSFILHVQSGNSADMCFAKLSKSFRILEPINQTVITPVVIFIVDPESLILRYPPHSEVYAANPACTLSVIDCLIVEEADSESNSVDFIFKNQFLICVCLVLYLSFMFLILFFFLKKHVRFYCYHKNRLTVRIQ
jgi:hypothetical protein